MKVSYNWLQTHIEEKLPTPEKIEEVLIFHAFEVESTEVVGDDAVFDIKVLPDRAADCLSHRGIARELAGLLSLTLKKEPENFVVYPKPVEGVAVTTEHCRKYILAKLTGITFAETPGWMKDRLEAIGQQSINAIVDCANYLMFDLGQPVHIFDAAKVDGALTVREARPEEKFITLSGDEKILPAGAIVVTDVLGALAIAGIKGGKSAMVTTETKDILIEVANFDPVVIRKTAKKLGLPTDAAKRFENNFPATLALPSAHACVTLLQSVVGGTVEWFDDSGEIVLEEKKLSFSVADINKVLGTDLSEDSISLIFTRYGYFFTKKDQVFVFTIPSFRPDITGLHDIIEEVGRIYGYENIESVPIPFVLTQEQNENFSLITKTKHWLVAQGFMEVQTYSFRKKGNISVAYGAVGKSALRADLSEGLRESYELNMRNAPVFGLSKIKLFEIGTVFFDDHEEMHVATIEGGTIQEMLLEHYITNHPEIKEYVMAEQLFSESVSLFRPWSVYPFIIRDIAVWTVNNEGSLALEKIVTNFAKEYCIRPPVLFDTFTKDGKTSIAYRFVFQSSGKTLTDTEVEKTFSLLIADIKKNPEFEIR